MTVTAVKAPTMHLTTETCDEECPALAQFRYRSEETGNVLDLCGHHSDARGPVLDEMEWRIVGWRKG